MPWPGSLIGWSIVLCTKSLWVHFLVRAHMKVVGSIPSVGISRRLTMMFLSHIDSLSFSLKSINISSSEDRPPQKKEEEENQASSFPLFPTYNQ